MKDDNRNHAATTTTVQPVQYASLRVCIWAVVLIISMGSLFYSVDVSYTISIRTRQGALAAMSRVNHAHVLSSAQQEQVADNENTANNNNKGNAVRTATSTTFSKAAESAVTTTTKATSPLLRATSNKEEAKASAPQQQDDNDDEFDDDDSVHPKAAAARTSDTGALPFVLASQAVFDDWTPLGESCPQSKTTLIEHRARRTAPVPLDSFLQGPGLQAMAQNTSDTAACQFVELEFSKHFPHAMEQLYRCFSYWQANPTKQALLVHPAGYAHLPAGDDRTTQREIVRLQSSDQVLFFRGMSLAFLEVFGVRTTVTVPPVETVPLVQSTDVQGFWDHSFALERPQHARALAQGLQDHYQLMRTPNNNNNNDQDGSKPMVAGCPAGKDVKKKRMPRIAILNREAENSKRSILNVQSLADSIQSQILQKNNNDDNDDTQVPIVLFEEQNFLEQVAFYGSVDIVVSPHGAQLTGLPFMPQCGGLVEVFPMGYYYPDYFGSLAESVGLDYQALYSSDGNLDEEVALWMSDTPHRRRVRERNFCPTKDALVEAVQSAVDAWFSCCQEEPEPV